MCVKDLEEENKKAQGHVILALTLAVCLSSSPQCLGFLATSCPSPGQHFYLEEAGERISFREGHLERSFDASPLRPIPIGLLIFRHVCLEPGCVFVWSGSRFMDCSCTLESLEYFNYDNCHVLGPFGVDKTAFFSL